MEKGHSEISFSAEAQEVVDGLVQRGLWAEVPNDPATIANINAFLDSSHRSTATEEELFEFLRECGYKDL